MTAVGLGQQDSQAAASGFKSLPRQKILRFIPNIFRYPKLVTILTVALRIISAL